MNNKKKLELVNRITEKILKKGADECSVTYIESMENNIEFRKKKIETLKRSVSKGINISIYKNNRFSSHSTSSLNEEDLEKFIDRGIEMTSYLNIDKFRSLPDPKYYKNRKKKDLKIYDNNINAISTKDKIKTLKMIDEAILKSGENIISSTVGFSDSHTETILLNSNGFLGTKISTSFSLGAEVTIKDDKGKLIEDYFYAGTRELQNLPDWGMIAHKSIKNTLRKRGQSKIKSGEYETVVENRVVGTLLNTLISPLGGQLIYLKKSYLENMKGKKIGSEELNIIDDPFIMGGLGSRLFDSEGLTSLPRKIVDKGVLNGFYINSYYGKKLKMESTSGSYSNLVIPKGKKTLNEIISEITKGILITGFIGGNFNSTTGDFSFGITGILIENGKYKNAVNEMNITGNSLDLWKNFCEAATDTFEFSRIRTPSLRFSNIQFSGS